MSVIGSREPLRVLEQGKDRVRLRFGESSLAAKWSGHGGGEIRDSRSCHEGTGTAEWAQRPIPSLVASCGPTRPQALVSTHHGSQSCAPG